jgi:metal-responsive CopG/Arc/MetJ family transcriptional regulator
MPDKPKTQHRSVRIDDDLWNKLDEVAKELGVDRATILRDLARWFVREPGAKLPKRPE